MRGRVLAGALLVAFAAAGARGADMPTCGPESTQLDLDQCAGSRAKQADRELNAVYQRVLHDYAADAAFIAALKRAQVAWLAFRDAQLHALYPGPSTDYGSVYPVCEATELERLTRARTAELKRWLDGVQEGDVCAGSVHLKEGSGDPD